MKLYRRHGALIVESDWIVKLAGFLGAGRNGAAHAKAATFVPFVFVRNDEYATPLFILHERIHIRQQIETLIIGLWVLQIVEDIYSRVFLGLKSPEYYLYRAAEQEAYRNQHDMKYLERRKWFSLLKYIADKKYLTFNSNKAPEVLIGKSMK